jgi:CelD/BcsL family acetyltransferase involved in cellulose biosynthesis
LKIDIVVASGKDADRWDAINAASPHGTLFHRWKWLKIAERFTSARLSPLMFVSEGEPLGIFPLFFRKSSFMRTIFSPPPRLAIRFHGPVISDQVRRKGYKKEQILLDVQKAADDFIVTTFHPHLTVISHPPRMVDVRSFLWRGYGIEVVYDYLSDLRPGPEKLWEALKANQQRNLRKSEKMGLSFEEGQEKDLDVLLDLLDRRYREQGKMVNLPGAYLHELLRAFPGEVNLYVVRMEEEIVTGAIDLLISPDEMTTWIGNPKPAVPMTPSPNDLLSWEAMKRASARGIPYYSVLGAATNERLSRYYAAKFPDHQLRMRYVVRKGVISPELLLGGYSRIVKPFSERIRSWF